MRWDDEKKSEEKKRTEKFKKVYTRIQVALNKSTVGTSVMDPRTKSYFLWYIIYHQQRYVIDLQH